MFNPQTLCQRFHQAAAPGGTQGIAEKPDLPQKEREDHAVDELYRFNRAKVKGFQ
jgi:hypothetical protein